MHIDCCIQLPVLSIAGGGLLLRLLLGMRQCRLLLLGQLLLRLLRGTRRCRLLLPRQVLLLLPLQCWLLLLGV
jgi:hypothetical protein